MSRQDSVFTFRQVLVVTCWGWAGRARLGSRRAGALGEHAWRQSGLGAPADIDALTCKITGLEQQVIDLRMQLDERDQDLAAARAANRELMAQINTTATRGR